MLNQIPQVDYTALIGNVVQSVISIGLIAWVYTVLNAIIKDLRTRVDGLKTEVEKLKASENKWYKKCHAYQNIIYKNKCKDDCKIHQAYIEYTEKEGEII